jgi:cephalosporin hydroxylase
MSKAATISGWMPEHELAVIYEIANRVKPRTVVEIGSWIGRSAVAWAESLSDAMIYCVDPWPATMHHDLSDLSGSALYDPYEKFLENTKPYPNIRPLRLRSNELVWPDCAHADLVFIDGDHSEAAVMADLILAARMTHGRGTICGHDYEGIGTPNVKSVVDRWQNKYKLQVHATIFELSPKEAC